MYKIELELLKNCNLRCKYCYQDHYLGEMPIETAKNAIDFGIQRALALGKKEIGVIFFGGEPLLKFDRIVELTNYAKSLCAEKGLAVYFETTTNGILFDEKVSAFFAENHFKVKISMDGTPESHDLNRRDRQDNPSYAAIMKNVAAINHYQATAKRPIQISMIINKNTVHAFYENFKHIISKGFSYIDAALNFNEIWDTETFEILESQLKAAVGLYAERAKQGAPFTWTFIDYGLMPQLRPQKNYFCGAGTQNNFITLDGTIYPCSGCTKPQAKIGHIAEGYDRAALGRFQPYERQLSPKCRACSIQNFCPTCDCVMMNFELTGDYYQVPDSFCRFAKVRHKLTKMLLEDEAMCKILQKEKSFI